MWELVSVKGKTLGNRRHEDLWGFSALLSLADCGLGPESSRALTQPATSCPLWGKWTEVSGADPRLALDLLLREGVRRPSSLPSAQRPWGEASALSILPTSAPPHFSPCFLA